MSLGYVEGLVGPNIVWSGPLMGGLAAGTRGPGHKAVVEYSFYDLEMFLSAKQIFSNRLPIILQKGACQQ